MIKKEGNKWVLYNKAGTKVLGTHKSEASAKAQESAINVSKAKAAGKFADEGESEDYETSRIGNMFRKMAKRVRSGRGGGKINALRRKAMLQGIASRLKSLAASADAEDTEDYAGLQSGIPPRFRLSLQGGRGWRSHGPFKAPIGRLRQPNKKDFMRLKRLSPASSAGPRFGLGAGFLRRMSEAEQDIETYGNFDVPREIVSLLCKNCGEEMEKRNMSALKFSALPEEVQEKTVALLEFADEKGGNVGALIDWAGEVGFSDCVAKVPADVTDEPEKLCGWLKAQAHSKDEAEDDEQVSMFAEEWQPSEIDVPFMKAGDTVDGRAITQDEITEILAEYDPVGKHKAQVVPDHTTENGEALGWVKKLYQVKDWIYAKVKPSTQENESKLKMFLAPDGPFEKRSPEIWPNFMNSGKPYLRRIALLGAAPAAIPGQPEMQFAECFGSDDYGDWIALTYEGEKIMPDNIGSKDSVAFKALVEQSNSQAEQIKKLQADVAKYKATADEVDTYKAELKKMSDDNVAVKRQLQRKETEEVINQLRAEGRITPHMFGAYEDKESGEPRSKLVDRLMRLREIGVHKYADGSEVDEYKEEIGHLKSLPITISPKQIVRSERMEEFSIDTYDEKIRAYQAEKGIKSYKEAKKAFNAANPAMAAKYADSFKAS